MEHSLRTCHETHQTLDKLHRRDQKRSSLSLVIALTQRPSSGFHACRDDWQSSLEKLHLGHFYWSHVNGVWRTNVGFVCQTKARRTPSTLVDIVHIVSVWYLSTGVWCWLFPEEVLLALQASVTWWQGRRMPHWTHAPGVDSNSVGDCICSRLNFQTLSSLSILLNWKILKNKQTKNQQQRSKQKNNKKP